MDLEALIEGVVRRVVREELAAVRSNAPSEMVTTHEWARENSVAVTTVRTLIRGGRLEAVRIGKRRWRLRRDAQVRESAPARLQSTPADIAARILRRGAR